MYKTTAYFACFVFASISSIFSCNINHLPHNINFPLFKYFLLIATIQMS